MSLTLTREALSNQIADDLATRNTNAGLIEGAVDDAVVRIDTAESDIATLKGTGWTDETVKGNADDIATLNADDSTEGSVAKSIKDNAENATFTPAVGSGIASVKVVDAVNEVGVNVATNKTYLDHKSITVQTPSGFSWVDHPLVGKIFTDGFGKFWLNDFDVSDYKPSGKTYYVSTTGSNSNDGLTAETAFATLLYAVNKSDVVLVRVIEGVYTQSKIMGSGGYISKSIGIEKYGDGDVIFSTHEALTWSLTSTMTNTYEATLASAPIAVLDTRASDASDSDIYSRLTLKTSIAEVEATAGTYFWNSSLVYVHLSDDSEPDSDTWALPSSGYNIYIYHGSTVISAYFEGITFYGGSYGGIGVDGITGTALYGKDLKQYFSQREGMRVKTTPTSIFQDCTSAYNTDDGFSYNATSAPNVQAIEIRCIGYSNGILGTPNNCNGSTTHDGNKIIRLNCAYYGNKGPNIADITTGTESWNLGCVAFASVSGATNLGKLDFGFNSGNMKVWLDGCRGYSSTKTVIFGTSTDEVEAYTRNCNFEIDAEVGGSSIVEKY